MKKGLKTENWSFWGENTS